MSNASTINVHFPLNSLLPFSLLSFLLSGPFFSVSSGATEPIHIQLAVNILHIANLPQEQLPVKWRAWSRFRTEQQEKWGPSWYQGLGIITSNIILKKFKCFSFCGKGKTSSRQSQRRRKCIGNTHASLCMLLLLQHHAAFCQRQAGNASCPSDSNQSLRDVLTSFICLSRCVDIVSGTNVKTICHQTNCSNWVYSLSSKSLSA